ncbi:cytochrome c [bacterium]|nr:cytochrome c [bacterium]
MQSRQMPTWISKAAWVVILASMIPLAAIFAGREMPSTRPRPSIIPDMDNQQKFKAQQANLIFADKRADRQPVYGTVARGELNADQHFYEGIVDGAFASALPGAIAVNEDSLQRGRERYDIYCAPCHGFSGYGNGMVAVRADELAIQFPGDMAWTPPKSMHDPAVIARPDGYLFNVITHGVRSMGAYGSQIAPEDRWKIVLYIRALQKSQNANVGDLPADVAQRLEADKPAPAAESAKAPADGAAAALGVDQLTELEGQLTKLNQERYAPDANLSPEQQAAMDQQISALQAQIDALKKGGETPAAAESPAADAPAASDTHNSEAGK